MADYHDVLEHVNGRSRCGTPLPKEVLHKCVVLLLQHARKKWPYRSKLPADLG